MLSNIEGFTKKTVVPFVALLHCLLTSKKYCAFPLNNITGTPNEPLDTILFFYEFHIILLYYNLLNSLRNYTCKDRYQKLKAKSLLC